MDLFQGKMLDVGAGDDPLPFPDVIPFDVDDGDANYLSRYFPAELFDVIHASQCLEHLFDPTAVITDWLTLLKPGGVIICSIPDLFIYEGGVFPSRWNGDHKSTWSMIYHGSPAPLHIHIPTFLKQFENRAEVLLARMVDTNYDYAIGTSVDQTYDAMSCVEAWNEFVLKKTA